MSNESMGYCEGLCGGLYDHHLVDGLCPKCKQDTRIPADELCFDEYDGVPLGVESAMPFNLGEGEVKCNINIHFIDPHQQYIQVSKKLLFDQGRIYV